MEFYKIKNKLLSIMNSIINNQVEDIEIYINESISWDSITTDVFFYIRWYHDKDNDGDYDSYGFKLGIDGYLVDNERTDTTFHETFPEFITPEFDAEIYINLVDAHIESSELCPLLLIPELPDPIVEILNNSGTFDFFSLDNKMWLYEKTKNSIFLDKEILDIFIF